MKMGTILSDLHARAFCEEYSTAIFDACTENLAMGICSDEEKNYSIAITVLQPALSIEQQEKIERKELLYMESRVYTSEYAFYCGLMAGFEQFFGHEGKQKYSYDSSVVEGLFSVPEMKRHLTYYENSEENLKISTELENNLGKELNEHIVSIDCAWEQRINSSAVFSFYCGYRSAISVIERVDPLAGFDMTKCSLITEYELGLTEPYYPYTFDKGKLIVKEMADLLALDLVDKRLVTDQIVLTVGYDIENLTNPEISKNYSGSIKTDHYGRKVPKHAHGTANLSRLTSSARLITDAVLELYGRVVDPRLLIRRVYLTANKVISEEDAPRDAGFEQLDLFTDYASQEEKRKREAAALERERRQQNAVLSIRKKYGKNAILKGMNFEEGATTKDRNNQIGGHKA